MENFLRSGTKGKKSGHPVIHHLKANCAYFRILCDMEHRNGAVIRKRLFEVSYIEIYWGLMV